MLATIAEARLGISEYEAAALLGPVLAPLTALAGGSFSVSATIDIGGANVPPGGTNPLYTAETPKPVEPAGADSAGQPLRPTMAMNSPGAMSRWMSRSTGVLPNCLFTRTSFSDCMAMLRSAAAVAWGASARHPLTAPAVSPLMNCSDSTRYSSTSGSAANT